MSLAKLSRYFNVSCIAYFHELIEAAAEAFLDLSLELLLILEFTLSCLGSLCEFAEVLLEPGAVQILRLRRATSQLGLIGGCLALTIMLENVMLIFNELHEGVILPDLPDVVILETFLVKRALDDSLLIKGLDAASANGVPASQR